MKFTEIARNLLNEGRKYEWATGRLVRGWDIEVFEPRYCALGIKAREFGVPSVVLAYWDSALPGKNYMSFEGLEAVTDANDVAHTREEAAERLNKLHGEADIEGWVAYLKTLTPRAVEWATRMGYKSLLTDLPPNSIPEAP